MRKFKNTSTGELAEITTNPEFYLVSGSVIPKRFIEDYCGWEEQPIEYTYEILSFSFPKQWDGRLATLQKTGKYNTTEGVGGWTLDELLNVGTCVASGDVFIHSVRRKSDGSIFTVGERVKDGIWGTVDIIKKLAVCEARNTIYASTENMSWGKDIENICNVKPLYTTYDGVERFEYHEEHWVINNNYAYVLKVCNLHVENSLTEPERWKVFSTEEKALEYVESMKPKPLFTTEDGKDIFEGDTYWCVNTAPHLWNPYEQTAKKRTHLPSNVKAFTTKELLYKFILLNKPLLSLDDLLSVWSYSGRHDALFSTSPLFLSFKKLAKSKL